MLCAPVRRQETFHQHPELIDHVDDEIAGLGWIRFFMAGLSGLIFDEFANAPQVLDEATILLVSLRGFGMPENR
jgi:hypothetical protein